MKKDDTCETIHVKNGLLTEDDIRAFDETYNRYKGLFQALAKDD
ncbi:hypothetical protein [uncultured Methanolobus sp.]|nr:hypothetical protein [uncultured Methanolobus sp.]